MDEEALPLERPPLENDIVPQNQNNGQTAEATNNELSQTTIEGMKVKELQKALKDRSLNARD